MLPAIRPAQDSDHPGILRLAERLRENGIPTWRDRGKALAWHHAEARSILACDQPDAELWVAAGPDGILGFIYFHTEEDFLTGEKQGYVGDIAVAEEAEGKGIGRALLQVAEDWCGRMGYRILALDVFATNSGARAFYARRGFAEQTVKLVKVLRNEDKA